MSILVDPDNIDMVLLVDGWHHVIKGTFNADALDRSSEELGPSLLIGGILPTDEYGDVLPTAACWDEQGGTFVVCPMSSILAIKFCPVYKDALNAIDSWYGHARWTWEQLDRDLESTGTL